MPPTLKILDHNPDQHVQPTPLLLYPINIVALVEHDEENNTGGGGVVIKVELDRRTGNCSYWVVG